MASRSWSLLTIWPVLCGGRPAGTQRTRSRSSAVRKRIRDVQVAIVNRVEGSAEDADAPWLLTVRHNAPAEVLVATVASGKSDAQPFDHQVVDADSEIVLDGNLDVCAIGTGPDDFDNWSPVREVRCASQRGDNGALDFRGRPLDPRGRIFLPIDCSDRRVLDDARKHDGIGNDDAVAGRGSQCRQANADLFDAAFRYANTNMVSDAEGPLDQDVDAVDEIRGRHPEGRG